MSYIPRSVEASLRQTLARGRSVLLLGPRQTGKTTLAEAAKPDLTFNLIRPDVRLRFERTPAALRAELEALPEIPGRRRPLVLLDEVQRVPELINVAQDLVDRKVAQFLLTGSSARKLRRSRDANWLPGRVTPLRVDPLSLEEHCPKRLADCLNHGSLPGLVTDLLGSGAQADLRAYVSLYLDEEVRAEALVRQLGPFARFLQLAAMESGKISHFRGLAQELGIAHTTVAGYYQILEDCLIVERIEPLTRSRTRKKLIKSPRYLFFDLGVRRAAAEEPAQSSPAALGPLFEQWVGLELIRMTRALEPPCTVCFWRDANGVEVDWVLASHDRLTPVEVKWTDLPSAADIRHLKTFLSEHPSAERAWVVCRTPRRMKLGDRILAIPWQELPAVIRER